MNTHISHTFQEHFFNVSLTALDIVTMLLLLLSHFSRVRLCVTHRQQPTRLPRHQKGSTEVAQGNQAADQAAERAALQNNDLIGVATLVPQINLPEIPYTEGETLKAKSKGFQEDNMRWFQKEVLGPS